MALVHIFPDHVITVLRAFPFRHRKRTTTGIMRAAGSEHACLAEGLFSPDAESDLQWTCIMNTTRGAAGPPPLLERAI